jgi:hypothetical protein
MRGRQWIVPAVLAASVAAMGAGGALALRGLGAAADGPVVQPVSARGSAPDDDCCPDAAVHDRKAPAAFGLPAFPGAEEFHSMEVDRENGSVAFSVRDGSAAEIAAFYRKELPARGWELQWERPAEEQTSVPGEEGERVLAGVRQSWTQPEKRRVLLVLALDFPQKRSQAQAVLSWSPADRPSAP